MSDGINAITKNTERLLNIYLIGNIPNKITGYIDKLLYFPSLYLSYIFLDYSSDYVFLYLPNRMIIMDKFPKQKI